MTRIVLSHLERWGAERLRNWWVATFTDYPYLGEAVRLRGPAATYGMWVMLLLPAIVYGYSDWREGRRGGWQIAVLVLAVLPTLSKELLLLPVAVLLLERRLPGWRYGLSALFVLLLYAGTHFVVRPVGRAPIADAYLAGEPLFRIGDFEMFSSVYVPIKRIGWRVGRAHPWLGVGPGCFADYSVSTGQPGELPSGFDRFDPHSAWTGALAETGWPGLLGLLGVTVALWRERRGARREAAVLLLLFFLTSGFKDIMNLRPLWLVIGCYLGGGLRRDGVPLPFRHTG